MDLKLNLKYQFLNVDGSPMMMDPKTPMTVKETLKVIATAELPNDTQGSSQEILIRKMNNFEIFLKAREAEDEVELTSEEITTIKERAPYILHSHVLGPLINLLSGRDVYAHKVK